MLDKTTDKRVSRKSNWEILKEGGVKFDFLEEASKVSKVANSTASIISPEEEDYIRHKVLISLIIYFNVSRCFCFQGESAYCEFFQYLPL